MEYPIMKAMGREITEHIGNPGTNKQSNTKKKKKKQKTKKERREKKM
jgi:hypothetical protein